MAPKYIDKITKLIKILKESSDIINEIEVSEWFGINTIAIKKRNISSSPKIINKVEAHVESPLEIEYLELKTKDMKCLQIPIGTIRLHKFKRKTPLVKAGDEIYEGQTLAFLYAMKINPEKRIKQKIKSKYSGILEKVLVENRTNIDYLTPLFKIKKLNKENLKN